MRSTLTGRSVRNFVFDFLLLLLLSAAARRRGAEWRGRMDELSCLSWSWPSVLSAGARILYSRGWERYRRENKKNKNMVEEMAASEERVIRNGICNG